MKGRFISRRILFAVVFAALSAALAFQANPASSSLLRLMIGWFTANAIAVSFAYFTNSSWIFGKTEQGKLRWIPAVLMTPLLSFFRFVWTLQNVIVRSPLYSEVTPDLFVGRICNYESLPDGITMFVDLTAEFPTPCSVRERLPTICIPTLDGCILDWESCRRAYESLLKRQQRIYVCCANGHGRSVTFAAAWLGYSGICHSATEAINLIRTHRPQASPNRDQMNFLEQVFQLMNT